MFRHELIAFIKDVFIEDSVYIKWVCVRKFGVNRSQNNWCSAYRTQNNLRPVFTDKPFTKQLLFSAPDINMSADLMRLLYYRMVMIFIR